MARVMIEHLFYTSRRLRELVTAMHDPLSTIVQRGGHDGEPKGMTDRSD
jgi:hypothetical protein